MQFHLKSVKTDVEDDGRINIASSDDVAAQKAIAIVTSRARSVTDSQSKITDSPDPRDPLSTLTRRPWY
ncbi:MAG: hypothetical protein ABIP90_09120 [Vicinamibacterales bacterium]